MSTSLFPEDEITRAPTSLRERLLGAYTQELIDNPPVRSLLLENCEDEADQRRKARAIAAKDVPRILKTISRCQLEIAD